MRPGDLAEVLGDGDGAAQAVADARRAGEQGERPRRAVGVAGPEDLAARGLQVEHEVDGGLDRRPHGLDEAAIVEEQVVVLRLLAAQQEAGKVTVRIGHETAAEQMAGTSMVSTSYGTLDTVYGGMGVLGPTRMDYPGTISNVAAVALYIGEVLGTR